MNTIKKSNIKFGLAITAMWALVIGSVAVGTTATMRPDLLPNLGFKEQIHPQEHRVMPEPVSSFVVMENCKAISIAPEGNKVTVTCHQKELSANPE